MPKAILPHARSEGLVVTEFDDEILVYDKDRDQAHCLNQTAALVWKYSDGNRTVPEIAARMRNKLHSPVDEQIVWFALQQMQKDHLLRDEIAMPRAFVGVTRREFVKQMGAAAMLVALPKISSMTAPDAVGTGSCRGVGVACVDSLQCCQGLVCCPPQNTCQDSVNCTAKPSR